MRRQFSFLTAAALLGSGVDLGTASVATASPARAAAHECPAVHICLYNAADFDGAGVSLTTPLACTPVPFRSANNLVVTVRSAANRTINLTLHVYGSKDCTGKSFDIAPGHDNDDLNPAGQSLVVS